MAILDTTHRPPPPDDGISFVPVLERRPKVDAERLAYLRRHYFQTEKLKPGEPGVVEQLRDARDRR